MGEPTPPQDQSGPSVVEANRREAYIQGLKPFEGFIEGKALDSTESRAFCDLIDFQEIERSVETNPDNVGFLTRRELIFETVRQRTNEVPGYMASWERVQGYYGELMTDRQRTQIVPEGLNDHLRALKIRHIKNATSSSELGVPQAPLAPSAPPTQPAPAV
ncbi:MAG: hypothetical protein AAB520_03655 [Patescibacteria group bacterium]